MIAGKLWEHPSNRGILSTIDIEKLVALPPYFTIKRIFFVTKVPPLTFRGDHAHKKDIQVMIPLNGQIDLDITSKHYTNVKKLLPGDFCIVEPMEWCRQLYYDEDSVLLVLCSELYNEQDYIRDFDEFKKLVGL